MYIYTYIYIYGDANAAKAGPTARPSQGTRRSSYTSLLTIYVYIYIYTNIYIYMYIYIYIWRCRRRRGRTNRQDQPPVLVRVLDGAATLVY